MSIYALMYAQDTMSCEFSTRDNNICFIIVAVHVQFSTCLCLEGCGRHAAVLSGSEGTFGVDAAQYINNMRCRWKIQVETTNVGKFV